VHTPEARAEARKKRYSDYGSDVKKVAMYKNGGYVVASKKRIGLSQKNKQERLKYEKELAMCRVLGKAGFEVEMLEEIPRVSGFDILLNGIPTELKKIKSHNNIVNEAKDAIRKKGAEIVVYEFEVETAEIHKELEALKQKGIKAKWFFSGKSEVHKNY